MLGSLGPKRLKTPGMSVYLGMKHSVAYFVFYWLGEKCLNVRKVWCALRLPDTSCLSRRLCRCKDWLLCLYLSGFSLAGRVDGIRYPCPSSHSSSFLITHGCIPWTSVHLISQTAASALLNEGAHKPNPAHNAFRSSCMERLVVHDGRSPASAVVCLAVLCLHIVICPCKLVVPSTASLACKIRVKLSN